MKRFGFQRLVSGVAGTAAAAGSASPSTSLRSYAANGKKDFYETLGITRGASSKDIKKAYRKRAMETHPDQGGNKDEFAEVSQAYEVLSNEEKRRVYDQYGAEAATGAGMGGHPGGFSQQHASDIFEQFFGGRMGGFGGAGGFGGRSATRQPQKVQDVEYSMSLTLEEIHQGVTKKIKISRPTICSKCHGQGTKDGTKPVNCGTCQGSGQVVKQHSIGPGMVQQVVMECTACNGKGKTIPPASRCDTCHGEGYKVESESVSVSIPRGVPSQATLVVQGEGGTMPDAIPGDIHVQLRVAKHPLFERRGNDLLLTHDCTLIEALTGIEKKVKTLDGRTIVVRSPKGKVLKDQGVIKVPKEGLNGQGGGRGDLYVITRIVMPSSLTDEQTDKLREALGEPRRETDAAEESVVKGTVMAETKAGLESMKSASWQAAESGGRSGGSSRQRRGGPGAGGPGGQQAECVQQ